MLFIIYQQAKPCKHVTPAWCHIGRHDAREIENPTFDQHLVGRGEQHLANTANGGGVGKIASDLRSKKIVHSVCC